MLMISFFILNFFHLFTEPGADILLKNEAAYEITIDGTVTRGAPYQGTPLPNTKVYFMYPDTEEIIDSALTNSQGHYSCIFNYVGEKEKYNEMTPGMKVLGNPVVENIRMNLGVFENDKYTLRVFDLSGRMLLSQDIDLYKGDNLVSVSGLGNAGVKIVSISNGKEAYTEKIVQSSTGAFSPSINVTSTSYDSDRNLKGFVIDSVLVRVVPNPGTYLNFETQERVVEAITSTVDFELPQQMYVFSTTLKPYLETGAPVTEVSPGFYLNVDFDDGSEQFPVVNGEINIERGIYPYEDALGSIWISNDTSTYVVNGVSNGVLNWTIICPQNRDNNVPNIAQNAETQGRLIPDYKTPVFMGDIDQGVFYLYTTKKKAETQPGVYEPLDSDFSRGLIISSGNSESGRFIDLAPFGVADSLDLVLKGFDETTGLPVAQEQLDRAEYIFGLAEGLCHRQNGDVALPIHTGLYVISSTADERWQDLIERGFENSIILTFYQGTPGNERYWASTYTYNGELRLKRTKAIYNINDTDSQLFEEDFSIVSGMVEGAGQDLSLNIWDAINDVPSEYAYSIATIPALLNLGSGGQNSAKASVPKQYYSITLHGEDKTYSYSGENSFTEFLSFFGIDK